MNKLQEQLFRVEVQGPEFVVPGVSVGCIHPATDLVLVMLDSEAILQKHSGCRCLHCVVLHDAFCNCVVAPTHLGDAKQMCLPRIASAGNSRNIKDYLLKYIQIAADPSIIAECIFQVSTWHME